MILKIYHKTFHFVPFVFSSDLLLFLLLGCHGNSNSYDLYRKWTHIGKHNFRILAFKTEWEYYFCIRNYECKCLFNNFSPNYINLVACYLNVYFPVTSLLLSRRYQAPLPSGFKLLTCHYKYWVSVPGPLLVISTQPRAHLCYFLSFKKLILYTM